MNLEIQTQVEPTMYFIGVTTGSSSIMKVFPKWAPELGRAGVRIEGVNLKLHDEPEAYRRAVLQIKRDALSLGALVTTHKINLLEAARDLFDYLDPNAEICGEVSCISKSDGRLEGHAMDPITAGLSLDSMLGEDYFGRTGGDVLCLGAGGSTTAIALHFIRKRRGGDRPRRIVVVNRSPGRLTKLDAMVRAQCTGIEFNCHCHADPNKNDELMRSLPPASLVINATGMGKDLPGSPVTDAGIFPEKGIAWDLNYRGELGFLHQALAQRESRSLMVEDGWVYFLYGWTEVISQVLKVRIDRELFGRLSEIASRVSTPALPPRI
jgi:shikimate 5-dehydrogenase